MKLVENWKEAWKWFSVQAISLAFIWEALPDETKETFFLLVPNTVEPHVTSILLGLAVLGRLIDQKKLNSNVDTK